MVDGILARPYPRGNTCGLPPCLVSSRSPSHPHPTCPSRIIRVPGLTQLVIGLVELSSAKR